MNLEECRKEIDRIDNEILDLLKVRGNIAKEVAENKKKEGKTNLHDPAREKLILDRLKEKNQSNYSPEHIESIFKEIFSASLALQKPLSVAFLGPIGTFSHQAVIKELGSGVNMIPCQTIEDVFLSVEKEEADYGMVPVENSLRGSVLVTLDELMNTTLTIVSERSIKISHMLLSSETDLKKIHTVYSHEQPLAQCHNWLKSNLPNAEIKPVSSTASAAEMVVSKQGEAAIGPENLALNNSLNIIARHIEDHPNNYTRFFLMGKTPLRKIDKCKTSVLVTIEDRLGALHDLLHSFADEGINLTKIESRPLKSNTWQYCFFIDFLCHREEESVKRAIATIEKEGARCKVLGSYVTNNSEKNGGK
ncbi:MAG: prephenate dehydratase [Nitrospinae bacterium]|nr:prephenate dehydratase [Nitrospinota bacterium]